MAEVASENTEVQEQENILPETEKKTVRFRLSQMFVIFLLITIVIAIVVVALEFILIGTVSSRTEKNLIESAKNQTVILSDMLISEDDDFDADSVSLLSGDVQVLANSISARIMVVDTSYQILLDTYATMDGEYIVDDDVHMVISGMENQAVKTDDDYITYISALYYSDGSIAGLVIISMISNEENSIASYLRAQSVVVITIFLIVGAIIAFAIARLSVYDIKKLKKQLKNMRDGHMDQISLDRVFTEVHDVVDDLNQISSKVTQLEESRQEFVSNVSHELKTPITSMKVLSESLLMQGDIPAETYREFMNDIVSEIDREAQIINDLLTLVKTDKGSDSLTIENTDINELMEVILKRLKPLAEKRNIEIIFESFRDVTADIDKVKFTLAISNLIENAIKYNIDGGWIRVSLNADYKNCYIKVADSGVGIPDDCIDHVFERFYRVDKARSRDTGGTGLGLAITRNIILMHKGIVNVYSEPGKGTTFTVKTPINLTKQQ